MSESKNRRDLFRLDDSMHLVTKILNDNELEGIERDFNAYRLQHCLMSHLILQRESRRGSLALVRKRSPEIANYLEMLEEDFLLVATRIAGSSECPTSTKLTKVNLSSTSVSIETAEHFELDQRVEIFMTLPTSGTNVLLIAKVVRVDVLEDNHSVSFRFEHIHLNDEEAIIRHMAKLQQQQLHARRNS